MIGPNGTESGSTQKTMKAPQLIRLLSVAAFTFACASVMQAQASRTWVSGVGDDANPCSRTAPCKTFPGAISKTAAGGEIDAMDPGGFGTITITKGITIDGGGGQVASILASSVPGVTINAGASDRVILRNLRINGVSGTSFPGTIGINFIAGSSLTVEKCDIFGFSGIGIKFQPSVRANLVVTDTTVEGCAGGGLVSSAGGGGVNRVNLCRTTINRSGLAVQSGLNSVITMTDCFITANGGGGVESNGASAEMTLDRTTIANNQVFGIHSTNNGFVRISNCAVSNNNGTGLLSDAGGHLFSFQNNYVVANAPDGTPSGTLTPQ
jgi:hypothetical protein